MSDLKKYIKKRKEQDNEFVNGYDEGKIGEALKQARLEAGVTQEELAEQLNTKKSAISNSQHYKILLE